MEKFQFIIDSQNFETEKTGELLDALSSPDKFTALRKKLENDFLTLDNPEWRRSHILPTDKEYTGYYSNRCDDDDLMYQGMKDVVVITGFKNTKDKNEFYLLGEYITEDITDNMERVELVNLVVMGEVDKKTAGVVDDFLKKQNYFREYGTYLGAFKQEYRLVTDDIRDEFIITPQPFPLFSKKDKELVKLYLNGRPAGVYELPKMKNDNYKELLDALNETIRKDTVIHNNFQEYYKIHVLPDYKKWDILMWKPVQKLIKDTADRLNGKKAVLTPAERPVPQQSLKK